MKKLIFLIILILVFASSVPAQKVQFTIQNGRIVGGTLLVDVYADVLSGQIWNVGPTNIRIHYYTLNTPGGLTAVAENPASNGNINISNNTNYANMTSTAIMNDTVISLNILLLYGKPAYTFSPNSYWLGTLKFAINNPSACFMLKFLSNSSVFENNTPLTYSTGWTFVDPTPCIVSGVSSHNTLTIPNEYNLCQNYPNPFNPVTSIEFSLPKSGFVKLNVYDMLGKQVAELVNSQKSAGDYIVDFDASALSTGIYFYRLEVNDFIAVKKLAVIK
jgi:hypothetical protein